MALKHTKTTAVLVVLFCLGLVVWQAPSTLVLNAVKKAVPGIEIKVVGGSIWRGQFGLVEVPTGQGTIPLDKIYWKLSPASLLSLHPTAEIELESGDSKASGTVTVSTEGWLKATDVTGNISRDFVASYTTLQLVGDYRLGINELRLKPGYIEKLAGTVDLFSASIPVYDGELYLGDVTADLSEDGNGGGVLVFRDLGGEIGLDGTANFDLLGNYHARVMLIVVGEDPNGFRNWLPLISQQQSADEFYFEYKGRYQ